MNNKLKNSDVDFLFQAILSLKNMEELKAMSQRIVVAKMLSEHRVYSDIVGQTGASTATISRVNRSLMYGNDGYSCVFDRMKTDE